jgi:hypothetical protein
LALVEGYQQPEENNVVEDGNVDIALYNIEHFQGWTNSAHRLIRTFSHISKKIFGFKDFWISTSPGHFK